MKKMKVFVLNYSKILRRYKIREQNCKNSLFVVIYTTIQIAFYDN